MAADRRTSADECIGIITRGFEAKETGTYSHGFSLTTLISLGSLFLPCIYPVVPTLPSLSLLSPPFTSLAPPATPRSSVSQPSCIFTGRRTSDLFPVGGQVISPVCLANYLPPWLRINKVDCHCPRRWTNCQVSGKVSDISKKSSFSSFSSTSQHALLLSDVRSNYDGNNEIYKKDLIMLNKIKCDVYIVIYSDINKLILNYTFRESLSIQWTSKRKLFLFFFNLFANYLFLQFQ